MAISSEKKSVFDEFTKKYALSKTLRFELRPVGNTKQMLIDNNIVELDKRRKLAYEKTKPFFDRLHQGFINETLKDANIKSLNGYLDIYKNWKTDNKNKELKKKLEAKEKVIREEIVELFDHKATEWADSIPDSVKIKKKNLDFLFEAGIFSLLKARYGNEPETVIDGKSIFDSWDKWSGYFKKFFETRRNFYKSDGTATAVATRVVNDNLRRFCDNLKHFETITKHIETGDLEKELGLELKKVLSVDSYSDFLDQDGIDRYNKIVGGVTQNDGKKIKGINEYVNEYRQRTGEKLQRLKKLDKQIGSDKESKVDFIESDDELKIVLEEFVKDARERVIVLDGAVSYVLNDQNKNLAGIYFRKEAINTITRRWFANSEEILLALIEILKKEGEKSAKLDIKSGEYKFPDFVSLQSIKTAVEELANSEVNLWKQHYFEPNQSLEELTPWQQFLCIFKAEFEHVKSGNEMDAETDWRTSVDRLTELLKKASIERNEETTEVIKSFADRVLRIYQFAKYFSLEKSREWNPGGLEEDDFYTHYDSFYRGSYEGIVKAYNKIRNYVTKKPFNENKWVLNFDNPTLADGWDRNKETDNTAVILRKEGRYFIGVMAANNKRIFEKIPELEQDAAYEKLVYKLFPDPAKMMPKVCFSNKGKENFEISAEVLRIYENEEFKKGDNFSIASMQKLIDFYKYALATYEGWKMYEFSQVKPTSEYSNNIGEFYRDVAVNGYQISFEEISKKYIDELNRDGKLYLFEIHNKDWNLTEKGGSKKKGLKNLHTLYFEQLFSDENVKSNFVLKLNGEAELFFRPKTEETKLGYKIWSVKEKKWVKADKKSAGAVVKGKRYAEDKMFFHVPITLNRTAPDPYYFNAEINRLLANNPDINIIGIDRGEKHLAYLSVINQKGEILEIKSLNEIRGIKYAELLHERAKDRETARREWKNVEQIKDLKKGYISNVVREIADLIIKYNAIVVFEDLNMRFKQVRGGIEKSIYQQLEKALIDKLNYLVDKQELDPEKAGHVLRAYQLTAPIISFKDMYKQTGVLFYTQAEYTSQTDPVTGFRKNLYISNSATVDKIKSVIQAFRAVRWDSQKQSYFFEYDPVDFVDKKHKDQTISKSWRVYANVPRIKREKRNGYWETVLVSPNDELKNLFKLWEFDNIEGDIQDQILQMSEEGRLEGTKEFDGKNRNFWKGFIFLFNLVLQVRNSTATQYKRDDEGNVLETIEGVDFISSPVEPFFCTDGGHYTKDFVNMAGMEGRCKGDTIDKTKFAKEFNGDANGAYNIARKGLIILKRIEKNPEKPELFISRDQWDEFVQKQQD